MKKPPAGYLSLAAALVLAAGCDAGADGTNGGAAERWVPEPADVWQIQLQGEVELREGADVYDVDIDETTAAAVQAMHDSGAYVVCYLDAGAVEEWRADAASFPPEVVGQPMDGWPGERWLDVRRVDVLEPIMRARIRTCRDKGFDAIDPDNVEGYANETGFDLSAADAVAYFEMLARVAHEHGMSIGLKNGAGIVPDVIDVADFAVVEECQQYGECESWRPFADAGKAVLDIEYDGTADSTCAGEPEGFTAVHAVLALDRPVTDCP